ncbi:Ribosome biogenesis protein BRX1 [Colletotrichum higginsianum IMI 349063]|uniref:Ribosome biogenesis protein BRX1 n=1 Tax=Colletotrichum higginsianum (strain IMI 349063) TaxID=759273 RepID=A0A1B7YBH5_COLHI|nr:Ribosome biogenesis protein BRX1 [Colletotrichum higginsianum IMI 349063]OBR09389.1 Ribosome biogenesis protein BRX1 [Colletotrichum higginsianum IMI 349063]
MASVYKTLSTERTRSKAESDGAPSASKRKNAQRVLILSSRGITTRSRHLLNDIAGLLPHSRRESKFDSKKNLRDLAEMAELYNCNNASTVRPYSMTTRLTSCTGHVPRMPETPGLIPSLSQSAQRPKSKVSGPEHSYHVSLSCPALWATSLTLLLSREELNFSGNCLKGSRPILSFDAAFDTEPSLRLSRELLTHIFGVPEGARKAKPFVDHVMGFSVLDGKIWVRNYQVKEEDTAEQKDMSLLEIGPRFCLTPMFIQEGCFSGPIIYSNKQYVSPNQIRSDMRRRDAIKHSARAEQHVERFAKKDRLGISSGSKDIRANELDSRTLFA